MKDATMNPEIEVVNLDELPYSFLNMLDQYNRWRPISTTTEYCLYSYDGAKYILWLKYKMLNETKNTDLKFVNSIDVQKRRIC